MMFSFSCSTLLIQRAPFLERFTWLLVLKFSAAVGVFTCFFFFLKIKFLHFCTGTTRR